MIRAGRGASAREASLLDFLGDPASYPHRPRSVECVQTHASLVFLAPPFVYKVKKAVDFGFLDFSTLGKRRHYCQREVELNRRLTAGVYLGVVPIRTAGGRLTFGPFGRVCEYAVKMRKLGGRGFLHRRLERGEMREDDLDRLVEVLRGFYGGQARGAGDGEAGRVENLRVSTDENFRQSRDFVGETLTRPAFEAVRAYTDEYYDRHRRLFDQRRRQGRILDCHGDLHLEHIHLTPRALNIIDCIEFNDRFRRIDVANDVAFLAMDLDHSGHPGMGCRLVRRLAEDLDDARMVDLIDFYKCYRACVRGKVESFHSVAESAPAAERGASAGRARGYFRLALRYALAGSGPLVLVVMGRIATGKSTFAAVLGAETGWEVASSDRIRKQLAGVPPGRRGSGTERRRLYSETMTARTYDHLVRRAVEAADAGTGLVLDATYGRRGHREALRDRLAARGIPLRFIELEAPDAVIKARLAARGDRVGEVSDARRADFEMLAARHEPAAELDRRFHLRLAGEAPLPETTGRALRWVAVVQARHPTPFPSVKMIGMSGRSDS